MLTLMPKQRYPSEVILIYGINTINVLSPKSDQHETSPYLHQSFRKQSGLENSTHDQGR